MNHFFFVTKMAAYANKVHVYACLFVAKPNENVYYVGLIHSILYKKNDNYNIKSCQREYRLLSNWRSRGDGFTITVQKMQTSRHSQMFSFTKRSPGYIIYLVSKENITVSGFLDLPGSRPL